MKSEVEVNDAGCGTMDDANNNTNKNIEEDLSEVNYEWLHEDPNLFYDDFPPLPDFPCISSPPSSSSSSSSFSSSKPAEKPITACSSSSSASSSSSSSCAALKKDMQKPNNTNITETKVPLRSTASMEISQTAMDSNPLFPNNVVGGCMDMMDMEMEPFGFIDFLEEQNNADFFDPDSIFHHNFLQTENESEIPSLQQNQFTQQPPPAPEAEEEGVTNNNREEGEMVIHHEDDGNDEMSNVFLEWLKTNKDKISASDLRSVKLKKSTIESAAKRLGGGKQGMKRLLKLILEWVQTNHLKNKNPIESSSNPNNFFNKPQLPPPPPPCIYASHNPALMVQYPPQPAYVTDAGADYSNNKNSWPNSQLNSVTTHYNLPFGDNHLLPAVLYGNQYPYQLFYGNGNGGGGGGGDHGWRRLGPLATKEARKKRMARQRKCSSNQRQNNHWGQPQNQSQIADTVIGAENWVCWQGVAGAAASAPAPALPAEPQPASLGQNHGHQVRGSSDKRSQGWKSSEKNLKFLLQKVLKQSDVGSLGRIVLPKKEAETHLPELDARDGISIDMEDIGTSQVWNMRYRYWPNNKSRMYLLENTGDFVKANGLQEGDFIVIYSDLKCGKFMIRGVKVRQAGGTKSETKKAAGKSQKNQHTVVNGPNNNATSSSRDQPKMKI